MKLPSLFPVAFFAGGILLSVEWKTFANVSPRICIFAALAFLLLGYFTLARSWVVAAALFAACAWLSLGAAAATLERVSIPPNLASTLIESGKLDATTALRWRGRLRSDPLDLPWGIRYEINLDEVESGGAVLPVQGGLRLTYYRPESSSFDPPAARAGDRVEVLAQARTIRNYGDPGSFDFRGYLARQNIQLQATLRNAQLFVVIGHPRLTFSDHLSRARGRFLRSLNELFASRPDEAALARAMLLGDRSFVEHDRVVEFQKTGVYHVLALAGLHVGALAAFFLWTARRLRLGLWPRILLTLLALGAFVGIVEDRPPIVRAVLMASVFLVAKLLYRRMELLNIAAISALIILVAVPSEITDASFLLSFSAVATIGAIAIPCIERLSEPYRHGLDQLADVTRDVSHAPRVIQFRLDMRAASAWVSAHLPRFAAPYTTGLVVRPLRTGLYLAEVVFMSAVLQLGMLPPLAYYFHRVTLAGPAANVPAVLLTGLAVPLGFLTLAATLVSHPVAVWFASLVGTLLTALEAAVRWFAGWAGGSYRIPGPSAGLIVAFVGVAILVSAAVRLRWNALRVPTAVLTLLIITALIAVHPFPPRLTPGALELTVLDVGQGDSLFLSFPHGRTMLVDAGGLPSILENFRVHELWVGRDVQSEAYRRVLAVARARGVTVRHLKQGDSFDEDGTSGQVLWPDDPSEVQSPKNDDSLVLRLTDGSQSMLLAGDIERPSERQILTEGAPVSVNFLKVAHHGSKTSSIGPFLAAAHPAFAAISVGRDNSFGHPSPEVVERLEAAGVRVYRTDRDGAITAVTNGRTLAVTTYVQEQQ